MLSSTLSNIIKIFLIFLMAVGIAYSGACIYSNFFDKSGTVKNIEDTYPSVDKAEYMVYEDMGNNVINIKAFTNLFSNSDIGLVITDSWQWNGNKWVKVAGELIYPYSVYGDNIKIKRR